ncbi:MAG: hypothetical protein JWR15_175 [Prosthecobacter sp.]|nr:hypothetical protein [Prosthecobacter sp.]
MMKPIVLYPMRAVVLTAAALLCSCDEGSSGLQQRVIEVEAQRDMQSQKVAELQSRLNSLLEKPATPVAGAAAPTTTTTVNVSGGSDHAALIATASGLGDELAKDLQPGALETFGLTQMVGFKLKSADGFTSVVVPFFSKGDGYWECGWSKDRIKAVLKNKEGIIASSPAPAQSFTAPTPQPMPPPVAQAPQPAPYSVPPQTPTVYQPPSAPAPVVLSTQPQTAAPDGVALQPGERIVTLTDLDGNPQRAVRKADGTIRVIFK